MCAPHEPVAERDRFGNVWVLLMVVTSEKGGSVHYAPRRATGLRFRELRGTIGGDVSISNC